MIETTGEITVGKGTKVSTLFLRGEEARGLLVLAHGAGAGMRHPFLEDLARRLALRQVATFRYQFPYMERGAGRPDPPALLLATVRAAVAAAGDAAGDLPLFAGGKSMGGRMTSMAAADGTLEAPQGLVFFGYPLHAPGKTATAGARREHLPRIAAPMLFLQGTRDKLADIELMRALCGDLGRRARLVVFEEADHSFHVPKRTGRTDAEVLDELADTAADWMQKVRAK